MSGRVSVTTGRLRALCLAGPLSVSLLVGCASPTAPQESGKGGAGDLAAVIAELEGLDPAARRAKLVELAKEEGGTVNVYGSTNHDTAQPLIELFEEKTGLATEYYRGSSSDVLQRIVQEADAGRPGADTMMLNGTDMVVLADEKLTQRVDTPVAKQLMPSVVYDTWFGFYVNAFTVGWNTDRISQPPTSWEEVLTRYPGKLAMEAGDWDWFATLVEEYFVKQKGMSEDEAVELFRRAARDAASIVDGHTLMAQMLAAGEYDLGASLYTVNTRQLEGEGAPVQWEPPVEPLVVRPNGIAVHRDSPHPASALLFLEFMLTDGQKLLPGLERDPVNVNVEGGMPKEYDTLSVSLDAMRDGRKKWESLYEEVIRGAGKEPVAE